MKKNKIFIYGKHALEEALEKTPQAIDRVFLAERGKDKDLEKKIRERDITLSQLGSEKSLKKLKNSAVHQGVVARVNVNNIVVPYEKFRENMNINPDTSLLLMGEVQDPHNVGAMIRSAAAFGISGVLIPRRRQAPVTGTVVKVSAGMVFRVPIVEIGNVNTTIRDLKDRGFWIYGLAGEAKSDITRETFDKASVFVMGNEGTGIRKKTKELCDFLVSIPMHPRCESLNVAASTAVTLYTWSLQHPKAMRGRAIR